MWWYLENVLFAEVSFALSGTVMCNVGNQSFRPQIYFSIKLKTQDPLTRKKVIKMYGLFNSAPATA